MEKYISFILFVFLIIFGCTEQENVPQDPPEKVRLVQKEAGFDTMGVERGIDAEPNPLGGSNFIQLMWYRHEQEATLSHFKIYRSEHPEGTVNYNLIATTENRPNKLDTLYLDTQELSINNRYYYYVTAINQDNAESEPSDTVYYTLVEKATDLSLNNNISVITQPVMNFRWSIVPSQAPDFYILRIERFLSDSFHPLIYIDLIQDYNNPVQYNLGGTWLKTLFSNGQYRWRVDCVGPDLLSGSESDWYYFTANME